MNSTIKDILKQYWGYDEFRPMQAEIIESVLQGNDTLALLPTGGGKSICFQVPAMAKEGICIVISPLIALMKDQVEQLKSKGIKAIAIVSGMSKREVDIALDNCVYGPVKFLYLSPERLLSELVQERIKRMKVNLLAVDEAHCISQWGYDFRPPYLQLADLRTLIPDVPVLALTASATQKVQTDIQDKLLFKKKNCFKSSFKRDNLSYASLHAESKEQKMLELFSKVKGSAIVYVNNRRRTRDIALILQQNKINADHYHAGLEAKERSDKQDAWMSGKCRVIVATNAFGMGIDKSDVRMVIHLDLPESPEAYYQEAGRAGRDGQKAYAVLLYHESDQVQLRHKLETNFPSVEEIRAVYQSLGGFFQLAIGAGEGLSFELDISTLCKRYNFQAITVLQSLKILEREGYLTLTDALFLPARLCFKVNHEQLYQFQVANKKFEALIKLLLRSYEGLFEWYAAINENDLAKRASINKAELISMLDQLNKQDIIHYLPQTNSPQLIFRQAKADAKNLFINKAHLKERKAVFESQINAMWDYASSKKYCRQRALLNYFNEELATDCGTCDVCLEKIRKELSATEFEDLKMQTKVLCSTQHMELKELARNLEGSSESKKIAVIRLLIDEGLLATNEHELLYWVKVGSKN